MPGQKKATSSSRTTTTGPSRSVAQKVSTRKTAAVGKKGTAKRTAAKKVPAKRSSPETELTGGSRYTFPFEAELHEVAPGLQRAQNSWLSAIDSLPQPDRKTHELIRMVCSVIARNPQGIRRHAMLAAELGATWEEVACSAILAEPAFGILVVVEALPWARRGWERGSSIDEEPEDEDEE